MSTPINRPSARYTSDLVNSPFLSLFMLDMVVDGWSLPIYLNTVL